MEHDNLSLRSVNLPNGIIGHHFIIIIAGSKSCPLFYQYHHRPVLNFALVSSYFSKWGASAINTLGVRAQTTSYELRNTNSRLLHARRQTRIEIYRQAHAVDIVYRGHDERIVERESGNFESCARGEICPVQPDAWVEMLP